MYRVILNSTIKLRQAGLKTSLITAPCARLAISLVVSIVIGIAGSSCSKSTAQQGNNSHNNNKDSTTGNTHTENAGYMPQVKGTLLTYTITTGEEVGVGMTALFTHVHDSTGYIVGTLDMDAAGVKLYESVRHNKDFTYTVSYLSPFYYETLRTLAATFSVFTHNETPIVMQLPHKDPLHKIVFEKTISSTWHGILHEDETTTDNKVTQTEFQGVIDSVATIKTEAGTFKDCIRVHFLRNQQRLITISSPDDNSTLDNTSHFDIRIWMAKGIGPVKSKEINMDTQIATITALTKITLPK